MPLYEREVTTQTIVRYVSPDGFVVPLSGGPDSGKYNIWMGHEPGDLAFVDVKAIFDAAARQIGEEYVGETIDHAELEIPLFILDDGQGIDGIRLRREWFKRMCPRDRVGWLMVYTNVQGWRWVAVRRGYVKPAIQADPNTSGGLELDCMWIAEQPLARVADFADAWQNKNLTGKGSLILDAGPEYISWPQFTFRGPGTCTIRYLGNEVVHPKIAADETMLINTDEARPTVRAVTDAGVRRNLLPLIRGVKYRNPLPVGTPTRIDVEVTGGNANTTLYGVSSIRIEGLL